jgi:hypothetical protein
MLNVALHIAYWLRQRMGLKILPAADCAEFFWQRSGGLGGFSADGNVCALLLLDLTDV